MVRRGDIYFTTLEDGVGSEQAGHRPVVVVQNNIGNMYSPTVIVIPVTSATKRPMATHVKLGMDYGLFRESIALAEQIMTLDKRRLGECLGRIDDIKMTEIDKALMASLGIE